MPDAFIYDHVRTPRGRGKADGALHEVTALNLATQALAAFHAFQEERVIGVLGDLEERGNRRQEIGHDFLADRHESAAPRQLLELFKRRDFHRV